MNLIETQDGFSVNIDQIEAIEKIDDFTSKIHTPFNNYTANFPYFTLLRILSGEKEPKEDKVMEKLNAVLNNAQHVAL